MPVASLLTIPARRGKAVCLKQGQHVRVINTHGQQVIDTWAFNSADLTECMSMEHTRVALGSIMVHVGNHLVTNRRRPILCLVEDTSPGVHDTLIAACDRYRYTLLGCPTYHDNCADNLAIALLELGLVAPQTPSPWNLFMNMPVRADCSLSFEPPVCKAGDFVLLRAEMDCVIAFSACPQDIVPINGVACTPTEAHIALL
ncbi:MAG TPA: urea carboxylase-associated family protein [Candidatus Tectomicrobia bacterium]